MRYKLLISSLLLIGLMAGVIATDFVPPGDINGRSVYDIKDFADINATEFYQNGNAVLDTSSASTLSVNYSNFSNSSTFWSSVSSFVSRWFYDSSDVLNFNETLMNSTIDTRADSRISAQESSLNVNSSGYWDALDTPADINAGDITDDGTYILSANEGTLNVNSSIYSINATRAAIWDGETSQANLNVNSSDYWDSLNTPADINAGDITDDGTYILSANEGTLNVNSSIYSINATRAAIWDGETSQANLNVNSSDYWDSLNSPSDITGLDSNNINDIYLFNTGDNATGNYDFDSGTLFIDSSGNYVGFGTASPSAKVDVVGTGSTTGVEIEQSGSGTSLNLLNSGSGDFLVIDTSKFVVDNAGNVGIGTDNPAEKLNLRDDSNPAPAIRLTGSSGMSSGEDWGEIQTYSSGTFMGRLYWKGQNDGRPDFTIDTRDVTDAFTILGDSGNVGIGTASPSNKLHVVDDTANNGGALSVYRSLTSGSTNSALVKFTQDESGDDQNVLNIQQDGTGSNLYLDSNGNGRSIDIDSEATNQRVINIYKTTANTGDAVWMGEDGDLTYNALLAPRTNPSGTNQFFRNLDSTATSGPVVFIEQDESGDDQPALKIQQDGTGDNLLLDTNGNARSIYIDSESTTTSPLYIDADALTTVGAVDVRTNSPGFASTNGVILGFVDNPSATGYVSQLRQDGTGINLFLDTNGNANTLQIDSEAGTSRVIEIEAQNTDGDIFYLRNNQNHADSSNSLMVLHQDHASSVGRLATFQYDGTEENLRLDTNGDAISLQIDSEATSSNLLRMRSADNNNNYMADLRTDDDKRRVSLVHANDNRMIYAARNLNSTQTNSPVVSFVQDNPADDQPVLNIQQDASTAPAMQYVQNGNTCNIIVDADGTCDSGTALGTDNSIALCMVCS